MGRQFCMLGPVMDDQPMIVIRIHKACVAQCGDQPFAIAFVSDPSANLRVGVPPNVPLGGVVCDPVPEQFHDPDRQWTADPHEPGELLHLWV